MPGVIPAPLFAALRRPAGARLAMAGMGVALGLCLIAGARAGAMPLSSGQVLAIVLDRLGISSPWHFSAQQASVVWAIRFPRLLLGALIGASLGTSGAAMQGLFRNRAWAARSTRSSSASARRCTSACRSRGRSAPSSS